MKTDQINIKKIDKIKMRKIIISNIYKKDIKKWRYNKKILTFNFYNNIIFIFYKLLYDLLLLLILNFFIYLVWYFKFIKLKWKVEIIQIIQILIKKNCRINFLNVNKSWQQDINKIL